MGVCDTIKHAIPQSNDVSAVSVMVGHETKNGGFNSMLSATIQSPRIFVKERYFALHDRNDCGVTIKYDNVVGASITKFFDNDIKRTVCKIKYKTDVSGNTIDYYVEFIG